jgi:hypothetical protein
MHHQDGFVKVNFNDEGINIRSHSSEWTLFKIAFLYV